MRKSIALAAVAIIAAVFGIAGPASADSTKQDLISPENSLLVPVADLIALGFSAEDVAHQSEAFKALGSDARAQQNALRAQQEAIHPSADALRVIIPMTVYPQSCLDDPNSYRLTYGAIYTTCYSGVGSFDYSSNPIYSVGSLRAGYEIGRVLYKYEYQDYYYYSVWRGPNDYTEHYFDPTWGYPDVYEVQLDN